MRVHILRTDDSPCIPASESLLAQSGLGDEVEVEVQAGRIVIRAPGRRRQGWEDAFRSMAERGDDVLLDSGDAGPISRIMGAS